MSSPAPGSRSPDKIPLTTLLFVLILCLFWIVQGFGSLESAYRHDFLNLYTGASLARDGRFAELYDRQVQLARERELVPETEQLVPFVRPHFYALVLAPLSWLPYTTALGVWLLLQSAMVAACWAWGARRFGPDALVLGALYFPVPGGISNGQDAGILLAIVVGAWALHERDRPVASGAVLGLALQKFHLLLLVPLLLVLQRRWRMLGGFCATGAAAFLISLGLSGVTGVKQYAGLLLAKDVERLAPAPQKMLNVYSISANLDLTQGVLSTVLVVATLLLVVGGIWRSPFWRALAVALAGSLLVVPHVYAYDAAMLLLPLWLIVFLSTNTASRAIATALLTPLPFLSFVLPPPWPMIPALLLFALLVALARESRQAAASVV